jgi:hypothetical protein
VSRDRGHVFVDATCDLWRGYAYPPINATHTYHLYLLIFKYHTRLTPCWRTNVIVSHQPLFPTPKYPHYNTIHDIHYMSVSLELGVTEGQIWCDGRTSLRHTLQIFCDGRTSLRHTSITYILIILAMKVDSKCAIIAVPPTTYIRFNDTWRMYRWIALTSQIARHGRNEQRH